MSKFDQIRTQVVDITPAVAQEWFDLRAPNRVVLAARVSEYASAMSIGEWELTHQGIAFDALGRLVDGQHRVAAIVACGKTIRMLVAYYGGCVPASLDGGKKRTVCDVLNVSGAPEIRANHVAVARAFWYGGTNDGVLSHQRIRRLIEGHRDQIQVGASVLSASTRGIGSALVGGAVARGAMHEPLQRMAEFVEVIHTGVGLPTTDQAAITLRNYLLCSPSAVHARMRRETFLKTERAIQAFCRHEPVGKLYAPASDIYPRPSEPDADASK